MEIEKEMLKNPKLGFYRAFNTLLLNFLENLIISFKKEEEICDILAQLYIYVVKFLLVGNEKIEEKTQPLEIWCEKFIDIKQCFYTYSKENINKILQVLFRYFKKYDQILFEEAFNSISKEGLKNIFKYTSILQKIADIKKSIPPFIGNILTSFEGTNMIKNIQSEINESNKQGKNINFKKIILGSINEMLFNPNQTEMKKNLFKVISENIPQNENFVPALSKKKSEIKKKFD